MTTSSDFIIEFIDKFKRLRCLWQVGHNDYRSKHKRVAALEELLTLYRTRDPDATRHTVQTKINSLRGAFKKEFNKVKASQMRHGRGTDKVHVPKLWYYYKLLFLEEQMFQRSSSQSSHLDTSTFEDTQEIYEDIKYVSSPVGSPHSLISDGPYEIKNTESFHSETSKPSKRKNFDSFGEHVAEQLRDMPEKSQKICIKIISDALFLAGMGSLDVSSRIVTDPLD